MDIENIWSYWTTYHDLVDYGICKTLLNEWNNKQENDF